MKKTKMINSELSYVISQMGHTDSLTIGDCGLPIPPETKRIDLALTHNVPTFIQTLDVVLEELFVEEAIIASEIKPAEQSAIVESVQPFHAHGSFFLIRQTSQLCYGMHQCRQLEVVSPPDITHLFALGFQPLAYAFNDSSLATAIYTAYYNILSHFFDVSSHVE